MKRKELTSILALGIGLCLTACSNNVVAERPTESHVGTDSEAQSYSTNRQKYIGIADEVYNTTKKNTLFSPTSLNFALGLLVDGADSTSKSREALDSYLGVNFTAKACDYMLNKVPNYNDYNYNQALEIANSIWISDKFNIDNDYKNSVINKFDAQIDSIDTSESKASAEKINTWCEKKTHGLVDSIVSEDSINKETASVLVNSVYFESSWLDGWYIDNTKPQDNFTNLDGSTTMVDMIHNKYNTYFENDKARAFSAPYSNGIEFIGILPKQEGDFTLYGLNIYELIGNPEEGNIDVVASMPKLNFDTEANLTDILRGTELSPLFDDSLDFTGMTQEREPIKVSDVIQKTKIELDEYGTKAAAVTAIGVEKCLMMTEEPREEVIDLNRPFAFIIYDRENDETLFVGKVVDFK